VPLLAIETTCDETAAAVITRGRQVLGSVVASQEALHARWRGVVPELAARAHVERILPVIDEAVARSGVGRADLEAVAVAIRPGLVGSLLVGLAAAKGIALGLRLPLVGYDHLAAHLYACRLAHGDRVRYPALGLVVSGGHTALYRLESPTTLERLGGTIDDAVGEAFDKAAALLGLGYPGGPWIERTGRDGDPFRHRLPRPLAADRDRLDMSFSGLKTALRVIVRPPGSPPDQPPPEGRARADLAASFELAAVESIVAKVGLALERTGLRLLLVGGGVAANTRLRAALVACGDRHRADVLVPSPALCTDNAAMGAIAWEHLDRGEDAGALLDVVPGTDRTVRNRR
jgi:N6-L-threonylcarbamoyladenine synthase